MSDLGTSDPIVRCDLLNSPLNREYLIICRGSKLDTMESESKFERVYPSYGWRIRMIKAQYTKGFKGARK